DLAHRQARNRMRRPLPTGRRWQFQRSTGSIVGKFLHAKKVAPRLRSWQPDPARSRLGRARNPRRVRSEADMTRHLDVRAGSYHDSVALMRVSQQANREAGVRAALVAMATPLNLDLLAGMGFTVPAGAAPNDLLVAIDAENDDAL